MNIEFLKYYQAQPYFTPGQTVLLAVSGGEDSMVMADLFLKNDLSFGIAHCNFGLRGGESDLDEQLVRDWCALYDVRFHAIKFDTAQRAADWKKGTQETARILRYEWFEQIRGEHAYAKIVTAHHANDNAETLMINLFKGTGISGLHGIRPENGHIVRPLLFAGKELISRYAAKNNIPFREDASNASDDYLRNAVRHNIIPAIQEWFPGVISHLGESIVRFRETEQIYREAIEKERKKLIEKRGQDYYLPVLKLRNRQPLSTILYELLLLFGFSSAQIPHVIELLNAESGRYMLSPTHRIIRNRDFLIITTLPSATADIIVIEAAPAVIDTLKYRCSFSVRDKPNMIPANADEAFIDLGCITFPILLRKWRIGDYLYPLGMKMKKKKVSRLLIDSKVPLHQKEDIWIVECSKRIAWVAGIRMDERFKIKPATEKVLFIKMEKK